MSASNPSKTVTRRPHSTPIRIALLSAFIAIGVSRVDAAARADEAPSQLRCAEGDSIARGRPLPGLFATGSAHGAWAEWCERYDAQGRSKRTGPYREHYADGTLRAHFQWRAGRIEGPVAGFHENGMPFVRARIEQGAFQGPFELFHPNGLLWLEAKFEAGQLEGAVRSYYRDGALESETRYSAGREQGLARSFYPTAQGGRLRSEVRVRDDVLIGQHRVLDTQGRLIHTTGQPLAAPSLPQTGTAATAHSASATTEALPAAPSNARQD